MKEGVCKLEFNHSGSSVLGSVTKVEEFDDGVNFTIERNEGFMPELTEELELTKKLY